MLTHLSSKMWKPAPLGMFSDHQQNKEEDLMYIGPFIIVIVEE